MKIPWNMRITRPPLKKQRRDRRHGSFFYDCLSSLLKCAHQNERRNVLAITISRCVMDKNLSTHLYLWMFGWVPTLTLTYYYYCICVSNKTEGNVVTIFRIKCSMKACSWKDWVSRGLKSIQAVFRTNDGVFFN